MTAETFAEAAARAWHAAARVLGWTADDFWKATPAELSGGLEPPVGQAEGPGGERIAALMARFPDDEKTRT
jgi:hypothetical protein